MKIVLSILILFLIFCSARAQKPPLDFEAIKNWPYLENEKISDNGRYIIYNISRGDSTSLVIQSTNDSFKFKVERVRDAIFCDDSKKVIYKTPADSLAILDLISGEIQIIDKIISFKLLIVNNRQYVIYEKEDSDKDFVILDLHLWSKKIYHHTSGYLVSKNGNRVLLRQYSKLNKSEIDSVRILEISNYDFHFVWRGQISSDWSMDSSGSQIVFLKTNNETGANEIWYYKIGMDSAVLLAGNLIEASGKFGILNYGISFSLDGHALFFKRQAFDAKAKEDSAKPERQLTIWSYKDSELLFSSDNREVKSEYVIDLLSRKEFAVETKKGDNSYSWCEGCYANDKVLVLSNRFGDSRERNWRPSAKSDLIVFSTKDGSREKLVNDFYSSSEVGFSPKGNYLWWFDDIRGNWFTHDFRTNVTTNITKQIPISFVNKDDERGDNSYDGSYGTAGWVENDAAILLYDKFDIWMVDPSGIKPAKNLTLSFGRKHHTILRFIDFRKRSTLYQVQNTFSVRDSIILSTFDTLSKMTGFARLKLDLPHAILSIKQAPIRYFKDINSELHADPDNAFCLKALHADAYVFKPSKDTIYPNLSFTTDLIHFHDLSHLTPQKSYNWYTDELIEWNGFDGRINTGVLFKPENFDSQKKYPLIVFIYEQVSDDLYLFLKPTLPRGDMEILWYLSRGYLILLPDIHYTIGQPGKSAYNAVVSAVNYIKRMPWVDGKRLGLQGHSFGGYEVNYIVTKTQLFAAASAASAVTDLVSESGQLLATSGYHSFFERGQGRMGASLWQIRNRYIEESPIFNADKVTTPLLIVHNPLDNGVFFSQGVEWFTGLRRLGKKAWMLQYANEKHNINNEENQLDYTIRLNQFFDHYLKGAPPPKWMTEGGTNLEIDSSGRKP